MINSGKVIRCAQKKVGQCRK